jgi:BirA family biotin operon repressor/biotin-[acetyl-CoA-carboxylase] ligase
MIIGEPILWLETTTSTMDDAARLAADGAPEGLVVVADEQTAGRGRAGRGWVAPRGTSLLLSILLRPLLPASRLLTLPLVTGVAVAEAVEQSAGVRCDLKWPNDVLIDGRKLAGILTSTKASVTGGTSVIVGLGINVTTPDAALPPGAISLLTATGIAHDRRTLLDLLLTRFAARYQEFLASGGQPDLTAWTGRAAYLGAIVDVQEGSQTITGRFLGVDASGALQLELADGTLRRVVSGDLVRGPRLSGNP